MTEEEKKAQELETVKKQAEEKIKELVISQTDISVKNITEDILKEREEEMKKLYQSKEDFEEAKKALEKQITDISVEVKKQLQTRHDMKVDVKSPRATIKAMSETLESMLEENHETLKSNNHLGLTKKAITPASFTPSGAYQGLNNQDLPMDISPYAPVYLRTLFPNISTSKEYLTILKRDGITGSADIWKRGTGSAGADVAKPELTPKWKTEAVKVDWIAGITNVQKEVLDDIDFVRTEIPQALIFSEAGIMAKENEMILDYIKTNAVNFTGDAEFAIGVEKVLAAAFGQLGGKYLTPTHILINRMDYLTYLQFNKASGSGEYDLPNTTISFINGRMFISGLEAVPVNELDPKEAYVIASARSRFVSRQEVQLRVSEETGDNFIKNMVTFRAEERVGFFTYDNNSFVKVTLPDATTEPVEP